MASANTICKKLLGVKSAVVTGQDFYIDQDGVTHLRIHACPNRWHADDCPICHKHCRPYDVQSKFPRTWRALDWEGIPMQRKLLCKVEVESTAFKPFYLALLCIISENIFTRVTLRNILSEVLYG